MTVEQISVFVQNRTGQLDDVTRVLEAAGINIRALSLADTADFGVFRLMADDTARAGQVLREAGFTFVQHIPLTLGVANIHIAVRG
jgi:hypothetical protein